MFQHLRSSEGCAAADAARREQEPIHEDALAVVVGIVGEQPVPLVLLLAAAVAAAAPRPRFAACIVNRFSQLLGKLLMKDLTCKLLGAPPAQSAGC